MGVETARVVRSELVEGLLRELICVFCTDLVDPTDALQAACGHVFCTPCVHEAIEKKCVSCPMDKSPFQEQLRPLREANPIVFRQLGSTEVRCVNYADGCGWRGELLDVKQHMLQCKGKPRHCQCCSSAKADLRRAKELIVGYEHLVADLQGEIQALSEEVGALKGQVQEKARLLLAAGGADLAGAVRSLQVGSQVGSQVVSQAGSQEKAEPPYKAPQHNAKGSSRPRPVLAAAAAVSAAAAAAVSAVTSAAAEAVSSKKAAASPSPHTLSSRSFTSRSQTALVRQPWQGGFLVGSLPGHTDRVTKIIVCPRGDIIFSGSLDGTIRLWRRNQISAHLLDTILDTGSGEYRANDHGPAAAVFDLVLDPVSGTLFSCSEDGMIRMWRDGRCVGCTGCRRGRESGRGGGRGGGGGGVGDGEGEFVFGSLPLRMAWHDGVLLVAFSDGEVSAWAVVDDAPTWDGNAQGQQQQQQQQGRGHTGMGVLRRVGVLRAGTTSPSHSSSSGTSGRVSGRTGSSGSNGSREWDWDHDHNAGGGRGGDGTNASPFKHGFADVVTAPDGTIYFTSNHEQARQSSGNRSGSGSRGAEEPEFPICVYRGGAVAASLLGHKAQVVSLAIGPPLLFSGDSNSSSSSSSSSSGGGKGGAGSCPYFAAGPTLYSLSLDGEVRIWSGGKCVDVQRDWAARNCLVVGPDSAVYCPGGGKYTGSGGAGGGGFEGWGGNDSPGKGITFAWHGRRLLAAFEDGMVSGGEEVCTVALGRDGTLYCGEKRGAIRVWHASED
ncbi:hypothetical protein CLOM_g19016 [Closterium sp. NIES-68]|nr:hypothetical protein CLOM_g19016 [Closterium sp. NIES-68]